jgi:hypothetical protein
MMAIGAHLLIFEIDFTTLRTSYDFTGYGDTTVWTCGSFVTDLSPTFGTFYNSHNEKYV